MSMMSVQPTIMWIKKAIYCGVVLITLLLCHFVYAEEARQTVSFNNTDILDVIRWAADLTDKNIIVSEGVKNKKVTVISGEPMTKKEAYETFLSILQVSGLAAVEAEGSLKIFPAQDAKSNAIPLIDDVQASNEDIVIRVVKVKNMAAAQLQALLKPLVPASAAFEVNPDTNIMLIADNKSNIEKIVGLVEKIDKAGTIDIEVIQLRHASAKDVVTLVSSLVPKIVGTGKDAVPTQTINFAADERSNSILMSGDPVMRAQIKNLIERIDQPLAGEGNTQVIYLNYVDSKTMAEILTKVSGAVVSTDKGQNASSTSTTTTPGAASVVASEANNALIITAPPAMLSTLRGVIQKLDVRREQVLVEALLVEVNENLGRQLGLFMQGNQPGTGVQLGGLFDPAKGITFSSPSAGSTTTTTTAAGTTTTTNPTPAAGAITAGTTAINAGGLLASYFRSGNLAGVLSALETSSDSNILSTPTIIALDNEEASILVGENVPFKTGEQNLSTSTVNTTSTSGTTTPTTSSYPNTFVTIQREDIGITLKVKPKINSNDTLTLEIEQKVESIENSTSTGASDIITSKREIKTKAIINDNQILVLGGLIQNESDSGQTGVPFLQNIPVIGWLFKGSQKTVVKKNLMIFIHPRILRSGEEGRVVSSGDYDKLRGLEEFYNKNTDFLSYKKDQPILPELPPAMRDPKEFPVKESQAVDVITVKKVEPVFVPEEPVSQPVPAVQIAPVTPPKVEAADAVSEPVKPNLLTPAKPKVVKPVAKPAAKMPMSKQAMQKAPAKPAAAPVVKPPAPVKVTVAPDTSLPAVPAEVAPAEPASAAAIH
jgi:general secretion pathway protein D